MALPFHLLQKGGILLDRLYYLLYNESWTTRTFNQIQEVKKGCRMITVNGKKYICLLDYAMDFIRGKWKAVILCHLYNEPKRFLELQRMTKGISQKVLNEKLVELVNDGLLDKLIYAEVPPKVEYYLTDKGKDLAKIIKEIEDWSIKYYSDLDGKCIM